jgi:hypothetical protein
VNGVLIFNCSLIDESVEVFLHEVNLGADKEVPPLRVLYFKIKIRLLGVVHSVGETSITLKNVERVPHTTHYFLTRER